MRTPSEQYAYIQDNRPAYELRRAILSSLGIHPRCQAPLPKVFSIDTMTLTNVQMYLNSLGSGMRDKKSSLAAIAEETKRLHGQSTKRGYRAKEDRAAFLQSLQLYYDKVYNNEVIKHLSVAFKPKYFHIQNQQVYGPYQIPAYRRTKSKEKISYGLSGCKLVKDDQQSYKEYKWAQYER